MDGQSENNSDPERSPKRDYSSNYRLIINLHKSKDGNRSEGERKANFSIATTLSFRRGHYSILWIAPPCPLSLPYNAEC